MGRYISLLFGSFVVSQPTLIRTATMKILRLLVITLVLSYAGLFLFPEKVARDIVNAVKDVTILANIKAQELDKKHDLVKRSTVAITRSKNRVETAIRNPSSQDAKRTIGAGVASFLLGLQLGGPFLGIALAFGSTLMDLQRGLAGDIAHAVEEIVSLTWKRIKEISQRCMF
jgi:hypothetical protein